MAERAITCLTIVVNDSQSLMDLSGFIKVQWGGGAVTIRSSTQLPTDPGFYTKEYLLYESRLMNVATRIRVKTKRTEVNGRIHTSKPQPLAKITQLRNPLSCWLGYIYGSSRAHLHITLIRQRQS
ncbi:hypothetical protein Y032_0028g1729 [Ancylostoma ceylanicum]|uniref:Uncharacterized protein n=1 Tax=Ancylostoma ceylanicum TaxID=53326 RepID=A0A016US04_9BILA|nr:hypothetical protein Y032_0028g1729 [Ancylostoma ceylanicum]